MKYLLITLFFFVPLFSWGQEIHIDSIRYTLSTGIREHVYYLSITNKDSVSLITWIVNDDDMRLSEKKKIKRHFFSYYGDFNLYLLLTDVDNYAVQNELFFQFFLKEIKPNSKFTYIFVSNNSKSREFLLEKIFTIEENKLRPYLSIPLISKNLYPYDYCLYVRDNTNCKAW